MVEGDRVHLIQRHELLELDRGLAPPLQGLQVLFRQHNVAVAPDLVALDRLVPLDPLAAAPAAVVLLEPGAVGRVQQMEAHRLGPRGRVELDRNRDQPEGDRGGGDCACGHPRPPGRGDPLPRIA